MQLLTRFLALPVQRAFLTDRSPQKKFSHFLFQLRQSTVQVLCPPCCEKTPQTPAYRTHHKQGIHWSCPATKLCFLYYRKTYFNAWIIIIIFCAASHTQTLNFKQKGRCWQSAPFPPALTSINLWGPADACIYLHECSYISLFDVFDVCRGVMRWNSPSSCLLSIQRGKNKHSWLITYPRGSP